MDHLPSFNYPFYPDGAHQQSFVDYGSTPSYDIDINEDDRSVFTRSKHLHHQNHDCEKFIGIHPTIPLKSPSQTTVSTSRNFRETACPIGMTKDDSKTTIIRQISNFYRDNPKISWHVGKKTVTNEESCQPQEESLENTQYDSERFIRSLVNPQLYNCAGIKYDIKMKRMDMKLPNDLSSALLDTPPDLLYDLMNESFDQQREESLYFDLLQGNTLAFCRLPNNLTSDGVLFYPTGKNLETLTMNMVNYVKCINDDERRTEPVLLDTHCEITGKGSIRQIDANEVGHTEILVGARSRYECSFLQTHEDDNQTRLKPIDSFQSEEELVNVSVSPYIHGDAVTLTNEGHVHIWKCGKRTDTLDTPSPAPDRKWPWYQCVYGGHPRCIVISSPEEADLLDIRANRLSKSFFSVKSKQVDLQERISALQRFPSNTHYYFIATDQSLLIMDDRFLQNPVLKWHHHLQDPVQFINVLPNAATNDSVVMVSGSVHRETHCFQFNNGQSTTSCTMALTDGHVVTPPVSTTLPWSVCSYDSWPSLLQYSDIPRSSVLDDRLSSSLIGLTCIPQDNRSFSLLQMSSFGDLFFQPFTLTSPSEHSYKRAWNDSETKQLSDEAISFCKDWTKELVAIEEKAKDRQSKIKPNIVESDCQSQFEAMISMEAPHDSCVLCVDENACLDEAMDTNSADEVCQRCGISIITGIELQKVKKQNRITTSKGHLLSQELLDNISNIFPGERSYKNSISQGFRDNWTSELPRPIELIDLTQDTDKDNMNEQPSSDRSIDENEGVSQDKTINVTKTVVTNVDATSQPSSSNNIANSSAVIHTEETSQLASSNVSMTASTVKNSQTVLNYTTDVPTAPEIEGNPSQQVSSISTRGSPKKGFSPVKSKRKKLGLSMGF